MQLLLEVGSLGVGAKQPLGGQSHHLHGRPHLDRVGWCGLQRSARAGLLQPRAAAQCLAERFGSGDDERLEVAASVGTHLHELAAGGVQHPQRLALATLARAGELVTRERFAASPDRIQRVALGAAAAAGPLGPVDLDHPLALGAQEGGQSGAVAAGAFQRPDPTAGCPPRGDGQQPGMPGLGGGDLQVGRTPPFGSSTAAAVSRWVSTPMT